MGLTEEEKAKIRQEYAEKGKRMQDAGKNVQGMGCMLTVLITIPVVLGLIAGPAGFAVGVGVAVVYLLVSKKGPSEAEKKKRAAMAEEDARLAEMWRQRELEAQGKKEEEE